MTEFLIGFPDVFLYANMSLQFYGGPHSLFSPFPSNKCNIFSIFLKGQNDNSSMLFLLTSLKLLHSKGAPLLSQLYSSFLCEKKCLLLRAYVPLVFSSSPYSYYPFAIRLDTLHQHCKFLHVVFISYAGI